MKAISKKLLSMLVVMAMVLSMVPFGGLSAFAAENEAVTYTNPGQDGITKGSTVQTKTAALAAAIAACESEDGSVVAECPACEEEVTWTKMTSHNIANGSSHRHYYWAWSDKVTFTSTNWIQQTSAYNICLYLNGMDLDLTRARIQWSGGSTLNIMGEGTINAGVSVGTNTPYPLFQIMKGTVNLYGGTYNLVVDEELSTYHALARVYNSDSSILNIYEGATLTSTTSCINLEKGSVNMYGGTIENGKGYPTDVTDTTKIYGGNVYMTAGTFNMYGGEIKGGNAYRGGNVYMNAGSFNMYGDAKISGGETTNQGGNIRVGNATVLMAGTASIEGGIGSGNPNVWLYNAKLVMQDSATVVGGYRNDDAYDVAGAGISAGTTSTVTLCDNATVESMEGKTQTKLINIGSGCMLQIDNGWTGSATFYDNAKLTAGDTVTLATCGEYADDGTFTQGGTFAGELLYYNTNTGIVAADGVLTIGSVYVQTSTGNLWYVDNAAALAAYYANGGYENGHIFVAAADSELELSDDIYIESRGYTMNLSGSGRVYALDRANDDYEGHGSWVLSGEVDIAEEAVNPINGNRYISIEIAQTPGSFSAHRIEVKLTAVTLRTTEAGLYYKAEYKCDDLLAGRISTYGVALNISAVPGANFKNVEKTGYSSMKDFEEQYDAATTDNTVAATSCGLFGIFKDVEGRNNTGYAQQKIYANAYIEVNRTGDDDASNDYLTVGDLKNAGTTAGIGYSLCDALDAVDDMLAGDHDLTPAQLENLVKFYDTWSSLGDAFWAEYSNIADLSVA